MALIQALVSWRILAGLKLCAQLLHGIRRNRNTAAAEFLHGLPAQLEWNFFADNVGLSVQFLIVDCLKTNCWFGMKFISKINAARQSMDQYLKPYVWHD